MALDRWAAALLAPLVCWILLNGLDDLIIAISWLFLPRAAPVPRGDLAEKRMAIFVPLWKEHRVIERMLAQNVGSLLYRNYDIFVGGYHNDRPTLAAIAEAGKRFPNVHLAEVPHDGPTSKADCLNWIYQRMLLFEEQHRVRFEMILTHDAEDVIHPESLSVVNRYSDCYDFIQIPVLALPTPWWQLTHGVYCDEFAQCELLDMPVRQMLGGFIPSNGVGTAFSRRILERLALAYGNRIFEPGCLTEDYENGFRVDWLGGRQIFVRIASRGQDVIATREFFPQTFRTAVRQRTRWTTGITLQSWELHGFWETAGQLYWFWRDRKNLIGNLVSPLANLLTVYAVVRGGLPAGTMVATFILQCFHLAVRAACSARIYGWRFAALTPLRMLWGNGINAWSTIAAICKYTSARIHNRPLGWLKTEHAYPNRATLLQQLMDRHRPLEEILTGSQYMSEASLQQAIATKPASRTLVMHLLKTRAISEESLYEAISQEQNLPFGRPDAVMGAVTRSFPASVARRWRVLPYKLVAGHLHVAGAEPPTDEMQVELQTFSSMEIRFQLMTPTDFEELAKAYLPEGQPQT
jgi:bacteriophage N4 adsorption protein B